MIDAAGKLVTSSKPKIGRMISHDDQYWPVRFHEIK